jgi:F-type H+-transporting ATPase subunit delta
MYARSLFQAAKDAGKLELVHEQLGDFAAAIAEVPELRRVLINHELDALVAAEQRRLIVELTTAYELSDDEAASIVEKIEQSSGRTVEATRSVDPDLIGGIVLQVGSHRLDASVKGRLNRLRHELVTRS